MAFVGNEEERQYRKLSKTLADFPWLYGIRSEWMYGVDEVTVTDRLTDLRLILISPARDEGVQVWVYREFIMPSNRFPVSSGVAMIPNSDGATLWAAQIVHCTSSCARIRYIALKFVGGREYAVYRLKSGDFNRWVKRLSETHPFKR